MKLHIILLTAILSVFSLFSCAEQEYPNPINGNDWMIVTSEYSIKTQDKLTITPTYSSASVSEYDFVWTVEDPEILEILQDNNTSITIQALKPGRTKIKVECPGKTKRLSATITVNVEQASSGTTDGTDPSLKAVFMGDSITENWNKTSSGHPEFFTSNSYMARGISGQTTYQMLARFDTDVVALAPKCVVICGGTNDIAGNQGVVTDQSIIDNIAAMASKAETAGIKVVLCSILPCNKYYWKPDMRPAERIKTVNALIKALADEKGYSYVDYHTPMQAEDGSLPEIYTSDGCHPNKAGYAVMEEIVIPIVNGAIK